MRKTVDTWVGTRWEWETSDVGRLTEVKQERLRRKNFKWILV